MCVCVCVCVSVCVCVYMYVCLPVCVAAVHVSVPSKQDFPSQSPLRASPHHWAASSSTNTTEIAPLVLPQLGYIQIIITEVVDPAHFWAQRVDTSSTMQLQTMMDAINAASDRLVPLLSSPQDLVGQMCVAPYSENGQYYRARIQSIVPSNGLIMVREGAVQSLVLAPEGLSSCNR